MYMLPLVEGKGPPVNRMVVKDGEMVMESYYPEQDPDWEDPEIYDADTYSQEDKEEFYDYVTRCHECGARFIAYGADWERIQEYCPGCGKKFN